MKRFVIILTLALAATAQGNAQNYMQHLKEKNNGQGNVTVTQSKEIDELVNNANTLSVSTPATTTKVNRQKDSSRHQVKVTPEEATHDPKEDTESPAVDTRKKVMRKSYKVDGYRVQVFAGGNSRNDKIKAQRTGNDIKQAFPELPVYVHFYSPRWICRVGNFRTFEEANNILHQIQTGMYRKRKDYRSHNSVTS